MTRRDWLVSFLISPFLVTKVGDERPPPPKAVALPQGWIGICEVTAYCPCEICCNTSADGLTSLGKPPIEGNTVAADPTVFPYGTLLKIEGVGLRIVSDCGGAIKGRRLDVYFDEHATARRFGRRKLKVRELLKGEIP